MLQGGDDIFNMKDPSMLQLAPRGLTCRAEMIPCCRMHRAFAITYSRYCGVLPLQAHYSLMEARC